MKIMVNDNIDEYKDDFYKGLTFRQTLFAGLAVMAGAAAFLIMHIFFGLPQSVALYAALPVVFPIAAAGFLKIHGMTLLEYLKARKAVRECPGYDYKPVMVQVMEDETKRAAMDMFSCDDISFDDSLATETGANADPKPSFRKGNKKKIILITEEDDDV